MTGLRGRYEAYDDYGFDGTDEYYAGTEHYIHLDEPRGDIVMINLADALKPFEGKRVVITITEVIN